MGDQALAPGDRAEHHLEGVGACPVCKASDRADLLTAREWIYGLPGAFPEVRCLGCDLVYLSFRPTTEALSAYYPEDAYYSYAARRPHQLFARPGLLPRIWYLLRRSVLAYDHGYRHLGGSRWLARATHLPWLGWLRRKAAYDLDLLLHRFRPEGTLLEVGCGSGQYLDLMQQLGWKGVVGVDISDRAVTSARETLGLKVYHGELGTVGFEADHFDAVTLSHTLEHTADPVGLLRELARVLKPGGAIAVAVPNAEGLGFRRFGGCWVGLDAPRHLVNFTGRALSLTFARAGLEVLRLRSSARGAYGVGLFSRSRQVGDARSVFTNDRHVFPLARRIRALAFAGWERLLCLLGQPAGEELLALARKPPAEPA